MISQFIITHPSLILSIIGTALVWRYGTPASAGDTHVGEDYDDKKAARFSWYSRLGFLCLITGIVLQASGK